MHEKMKLIQNLARPAKARLYVLITLLGIVQVWFPPHAQAGTVDKSVAKAAIARIGKAPAKESAKRVVANSIAKSERAALQRQLRDLDGKTLARIEQRFGGYLNPERLAKARSVKAGFLKHPEYQRHLARTYPNVAAADRKNIVGNYIGGKAYVDVNQALLPRSLAHERLHQLASPTFRIQAGGRLNEGMTEYFSAKVYRDLSIRNFPTAYPREHRVVQMMAARFGDSTLARTYFRGDANLLRRQFDVRVGAGAYDDFLRAVERGNFARAESLLRIVK